MALLPRQLAASNDQAASNWLVPEQLNICTNFI